MGLRKTPNLFVDGLLKSFRVLKANGATKGAAQRVLEELGNRGLGLLNETAQEVAQEGATIAGVQAASYHDRGKPAYTGREVGKRLLDTAGSSVLSFGLAGVPGAVGGVWPATVQGANATTGPQNRNNKVFAEPLMRDSMQWHGRDEKSAEGLARLAETVYTDSDSIFYAPAESISLITKFDHDEYKRRKEEAAERYRLESFESDAISLFVGGSAYEWTRLQREKNSEELSEYHHFLLDSVTSALMKFPAYKGRSYRNLQFGVVGEAPTSYKDFLEEYKAGNRVVLKAFSSASKDPNGYPVRGKGVHLVIDGLSARDIADSYGIPSQAEVVHMPGTVLQSLFVTTANDGMPLIFLKEVEKNGENMGGNYSYDKS